MFLEKINNFENESKKLKEMYSKNCPICKGLGVVAIDDKNVNCICCKKATIEARLICNGLPKKYLKLSFKDTKSLGIDDSIINKIKDYCENIESNLWNGVNLFINSHDKNKIMQLETLISNNIAFKKTPEDYYYNILIVTVEDLIQAQTLSRNNFEVKSKLNKFVNQVDILFINYLGEEVDNRCENTSKYINDIIVKREFDGKLTMLSSSLNMEQIANKYGINFITTLKQNFKPIKINCETVEVGEDNGYY